MVLLMAFGAGCIRHTYVRRSDYVLLKTRKDTSIKSLTFMERWALIAEIQIFIDQHLRFPASVDPVKSSSGDVYLGVLVEPDGRISEVRVLQATLPAFGAEAARVVKKSPSMKPVVRGGMTVRAALELHVRFDESVPPEGTLLPLKGPVDCSHRYKGSVYGYPLLYGYDTTYWCCNRDLPDPIHKLDTDLDLERLSDTDKEKMAWKLIPAILDTSEETVHKIFYMSIYASREIIARMPHIYRTDYPVELPVLRGMAGKAYLFSFRRAPKPSSPDLIGMYSLVKFDSTTGEVRDGPYLPMTLDDLDRVYRELRSATPPPPKPINQMQYERSLCEAGQEPAYLTYDVQAFFQRNFRYDAKVPWENYLQVVIGGLSDTNGCLTITSVIPSRLPSHRATDSLIREVKRIASLMPPLEPARLNGRRCEGFAYFKFPVRGKTHSPNSEGFAKWIEKQNYMIMDVWRSRRSWYGWKATITLDSIFDWNGYMVDRYGTPREHGPVRPLSVLHMNRGEMRIIFPKKNICYTTSSSVFYVPKNESGYVLMVDHYIDKCLYTLTPFSTKDVTVSPLGPACPLDAEGLAALEAVLRHHP